MFFILNLFIINLMITLLKINIIKVIIKFKNLCNINNNKKYLLIVIIKINKVNEVPK